MQCALFYAKHIDTFTSPKLKLLAFQVKANTVRDQGLLRSRCHNFKHLQHCSSSRTAVLLTFLEDIAQNHPSYSSSYIPKIRTIVLFLPFKKSWPQNRPHRPAQKICRLVVGKEASTLTTLDGVANCVKNRTTRKIVPSNRCQHLTTVSPTTPLSQYENLVHNILTNKNSTLEIDVCHFGVLY